MSFLHAKQHIEGGRSVIEVPVTVHTVERRDGSTAVKIQGHASVFDSPSLPIAGMFIETIARGAFRKALAAKPDVPLLFEHEGQPLASTGNGSMSLTEDARGLAVVAELVDTTAGVDCGKLVRSGLIQRMSFAFRIAPGGDRWSPADAASGGYEQRTVLEVAELLDVSLVRNPAYPAADVGARSRYAETVSWMDAVMATLNL